MATRALLSTLAVLLAATCADGGKPRSMPEASEPDGSFTTMRDAESKDAAGHGHGSQPDARDAATNDASPFTTLAQRVRWLGRANLSNPQLPAFAHSGSGFEVRFSGGSLSVMLDNQEAIYFKPVVDGTARPAFVATPGAHDYILAQQLPPGLHKVALYRQNEATRGGVTQLVSLTVDGGQLLATADAPARLLELVGDSISAGYGNLGGRAECPYSFETQSYWDSYGAIAARALDAELSVVAASGFGLVRDYDNRGDVVPPLYELTLPEGPTFPFASWPEPQVVIVNLGTNDFSSGDPGLVFQSALVTFLGRIRAARPDALIVCALGPMVYGTSLTKLRSYLNGAIAARQAANDHKLKLIEFPTQLQHELGCNYHPNAAKHQQMGEQLAAMLRTEMGW